MVDDEISIAQMWEKMLERLGYAVETRTSPVEALERFRSAPGAFDLVVTDMTMPKMTGIQLSQKLKKIRRNIPVVLCTGHNPLIDEEKIEQEGIEGFVTKPTTMEKIAKKIREVLDGQ